MKRLTLLFTCAGLLLLAACDKDKDPDPPAKLVEFEPRINIDKVWGAGIDGDSESLRLGLRPAVDAGRVYAASHDGDVYSFDLKNGKVNWKTATKLRLSGGPGFGAGRLFVGSSDGDVVAFDAADGKELWRIKTLGEVIAPPAATDTLVVIRTVDGRLRALNTSDGSELWVTEQQVPRLSLRGTAPPVIIRDMVVCGFDNGKVLAVALKDGSVLWETTVAPSRGRCGRRGRNHRSSPDRCRPGGHDGFPKPRIGYRRVRRPRVRLHRCPYRRDGDEHRGADGEHQHRHERRFR